MNSTASDHASQMIAHVHTAHGAAVPNVAIAMLCASEAPATWPLTTCDGRISTRMSSSALQQACAARKWAPSRRSRAGKASAHTSTTPPIAPIA